MDGLSAFAAESARLHALLRALAAAAASHDVATAASDATFGDSTPESSVLVHAMGSPNGALAPKAAPAPASTGDDARVVLVDAPSSSMLLLSGASAAGTSAGICRSHLPSGGAAMLRVEGLSVTVPGAHRRVLWAGLDLVLLRGEARFVLCRFLQRPQASLASSAPSRV